MAKLKPSTREQLPDKQFALPAERKYPITDKSHAANAKARATQMVDRGKLSPAQASRIRKKADIILGGD